MPTLEISKDELYTRREAAKRQDCDVSTIRYWERQGWLSVAAEKPKRYTGESLEVAAEEAKKSRTETSRKSVRRLHHRNSRANSIWLNDAAKRLGVSETTMRNWLRECPYLPGRRGIKHSEINAPMKCYSLATRDIKTIENQIMGDAQSAAAKRLLPLRKKHMQSVGKKNSWPVPGPGEVSITKAADLAGVSRTVIDTAIKNGELKTTSKKPSRVSINEMERWIKETTKRDDELTVREISGRISGPECEQKTQRIHDIIEHKIQKRFRLVPTRKNRKGKQSNRMQSCVHEDRFPEIKEKYLEITNGVADELKPGEIKLRDAAKKRAKSESMDAIVREYKIIKELLEKHAPRCIRSLQFRTANGASYTAQVAPRDAIEAALRGENWTPPEETASQYLIPPADATQPATASPSAKRKKRKGGRNPRWDHVVDWVNQQKRATPKLTARKALHKYRQSFPDRPCPEYEQFKAARTRRRKAQ